MAPTPWATSTEVAFLHLQMPDYIQRQTEGKLHLFWGPMFEGFLWRFPEHTKLQLPSAEATDSIPARALTSEERSKLAAAIERRKKQIATWFHYQRKKIQEGVGADAANVENEMSLASALFGKETRTRVHQAIKCFQKRQPELIRKRLELVGYNSVSMESLLDASDDWADTSKSTRAGLNKRNKSQKMQLRMRTIAVLWDEASPEERAKCKEMVEKERAELLVMEAENKLKEKTPESRQRRIDELGPMLGKVLNVAQRETGWVGMTILGGPHPRIGGELSVKILCTGETPEGNDFQFSFPKFNEVIFEGFQDFLHAVFPAEVRAAFALKNEAVVAEDMNMHAPDPGNDDDTPPASQPESQAAAKPRNKTKCKSKKKTASSGPTPTPGPAPTRAAVPASVPASTAETFHTEPDSASMDDDPFNDDRAFPGAPSDEAAPVDLGNWTWEQFTGVPLALSPSISAGSTGEDWSPPASPLQSSPHLGSLFRDVAIAAVADTYIDIHVPHLVYIYGNATVIPVAVVHDTPIGTHVLRLFDAAFIPVAIVGNIASWVSAGRRIFNTNRPSFVGQNTELFKVFQKNPLHSQQQPNPPPATPFTFSQPKATSFSFALVGSFSFTSAARGLSPTPLPSQPPSRLPSVGSTLTTTPTKAAELLTRFLLQQHSGVSGSLPTVASATPASTLGTAPPAATAPSTPAPSTPAPSTPAPSAPTLSVPELRPVAKQPGIPAPRKAGRTEEGRNECDGGRRRATTRAPETSAANTVSTAEPMAPVMVYNAANNTCNFNKCADAVMAACQAKVQADNVWLFNPSGPSPLFIVPLPEGEKQSRTRNVQLLADGLRVVRQKKYTRAELRAEREKEIGERLLASLRTKKRATENEGEEEGSKKRRKTNWTA
ncbi:hypothetical protein C8J57DRAFT_1587314 [Mycena rebaudengoi]|nr:hypothetical protein C8J57DRAFT_1587314 [Mycena rebaudengoi]